MSKVELRIHREDYRGVHAVADIKKGDTVIFVPIALILTFRIASWEPICQKMLDKELEEKFGENIFFAVYIMSQLRKSPAKR